jgi:diguanylate cyclase (GGDEF)-like protein
MLWGRKGIEMESTKRIEIIDDESLKQYNRFAVFPILVFDAQTVYFANRSFEELFQLNLSEANEQFIRFFSQHPEALDVIRTSIENGDNIKLELDIRSAELKVMWVGIRGNIVEYKGKRAILAALSDNTEIKQTQLDLARVSRLRMLMLEVTQSVLNTQNIEQLFQLILNNALKALTNGSLGTILTKHGDHFSIASYAGFSEDILEFKLPIEDAFMYKLTQGKMDRIVNVPDLMIFDRYYIHGTVFGQDTYIKSTISAPIYIKGELYGTINIDALKTDAFDADDERSMEFIRNNIEIALTNHLSYQEKAFLSRYDRLTGLYNRGYFEEHFDVVKEHALRYDESMNLVMFDMDNLKKVNDTFGHLAGDRVIRNVAALLVENSRSSDFIARLGGDEFIGIFYHTDQAKLDEKFRSLIEKLSREPLVFDGQEIICSFSYGIADFPAEGSTLNELIQVADKKLYEAKKNGKNIVKF